MGWFKRNREGITTSTKEKKETPEGLWNKCPNCKTVFTHTEFEKQFFVCNRCSHHERISSLQYFDILFDSKEYKEIATELVSSDPLHFTDTKKYVDRIKNTMKSTGLTDAVRTAHGKIEGMDFVISAMDFAFIGGSMGSVMGEKIARGIDKAIELNAPFMIISKSGGARMMEAGFSLMQMAKVSGKLSQLAAKGLPYVSFLTDPTTGGVTASFAMLGDINISEPKTLIAFAGPRVVKETIGRDLPEGFQTAEFLLEHGFLDYIVERPKLKETLAHSLRLFKS